jgi:hypothetical protein
LAPDSKSMRATVPATSAESVTPFSAVSVPTE